MQASRGQVTDTLDEIFAHPDFADRSSFFDPIGKWIGDLLDSIGFELSSPVSMAGVLYGLLAIAVISLLVLLFIYRKSFGWGRSGHFDSDVSLEEQIRNRVAELRAEAAEARQRGELVLALRLYFFALVVGLGEQGELAYNDAWTNRELLERGQPTSKVARSLRPLVGELDSMSFGDRRVTDVEVDRFEGLCRTWLGGGR